VGNAKNNYRKTVHITPPRCKYLDNPFRIYPNFHSRICFYPPTPCKICTSEKNCCSKKKRKIIPEEPKRSEDEDDQEENKNSGEDENDDPLSPEDSNDGK